MKALQSTDANDLWLFISGMGGKNKARFCIGCVPMAFILLKSPVLPGCTSSSRRDGVG